MSKIGQIKQSDGAYGFRGELTTLHTHFQFGMKAADRVSDNSPSHEIWAKGSHGKMAHVGVAWQRDIKRGEHQGQVMFSLLIDDPELPEIQASAFPNGEGWVIQTERKRRNEQDEASPETVPGPSELNDEIPF